jgi:hypothetical protein
MDKGYRTTKPLHLRWNNRMRHIYKLVLDTLTAYSDCLKVSRGPATIAPIDPVMKVLFLFQFQEKLSVSRCHVVFLEIVWRDWVRQFRERTV